MYARGCVPLLHGQRARSSRGRQLHTSKVRPEPESQAGLQLRLQSRLMSANVAPSGSTPQGGVNQRARKQLAHAGAACEAALTEAEDAHHRASQAVHGEFVVTLRLASE